MASDAHQWQFLGTGSRLVDRAPVTLWNTVENAALRYGEREYGINLVWDDAADLANFSLHSRGGGNRPITFGEHVAVRGARGGFLHYEEREYGINLTWSDVPVDQWEVTGGVFGQSVGLRRSVGLFNRFHGDHLVYGTRDFGINLRWWSDLGGYADYPPLPIPPELRGQSGEPGQIVLGGTASEVEVFHGGTDDELDWHIYIRLDDAVQRRLFAHLTGHAGAARFAHGLSPLTERDLDRVYCEFMVLDGYRNPIGDELFFSADVTRALGLSRSAWEISAEAGRRQNVKGATVDTTGESALCRRNARIWLQGAFVNDSAHRFRVELHPLDSLAYAIDARGRPLSVREDDPDWPASEVTWRVAAFTNSTIHRIDGAAYVKKDRTTTWYLPLPRTAGRPGTNLSVTLTSPGFRNEARRRPGLDDLRPTASDHYERYGVVSETHAVERDYRTGQPRLRVTIVMRQPDFWGGMYLGEYRVRVRPQAIARRLLQVLARSRETGGAAESGIESGGCVS